MMKKRAKHRIRISCDMCVFRNSCWYFIYFILAFIHFFSSLFLICSIRTEYCNHAHTTADRKQFNRMLTDAFATKGIPNNDPLVHHLYTNLLNVLALVASLIALLDIITFYQMLDCFKWRCTTMIYHLQSTSDAGTHECEAIYKCWHLSSVVCQFTLINPDLLRFFRRNSTKKKHDPDD